MSEPVLLRWWVVWSYEHTGWWGPNRVGYVEDFLAAGAYSDTDAQEIERRANEFRPAHAPNERAMSLQQALSEIAAGLYQPMPSGRTVARHLSRQADVSVPSGSPVSTPVPSGG